MDLRTLIIETHPEDAASVADLPDTVLDKLYPDLSCWALDYERIPKLIEAGLSLQKMLAGMCYTPYYYRLEKLHDFVPYWYRGEVLLLAMRRVLSSSSAAELSERMNERVSKLFAIVEKDKPYRNYVSNEEDYLTNTYIDRMVSFLSMVYGILATPDALTYFDEGLFSFYLELGKSFDSMVSSFESSGISSSAQEAEA